MVNIEVMIRPLAIPISERSILHYEYLVEHAFLIPREIH